MLRLAKTLGTLRQLSAYFGCLAVILMMAHISLDVLLRRVGFPIPAAVTTDPS